MRVKKDDTAVSCSIWEIVEDGATLLTNCSILLDIIDFGEIGFERKSDWARFCNKLDSYDTTPLRRRLIGDGYKGKYYGNIEWDDGNIKITFDEPISVVFASIGDEYIVEKVSEITGNISWSWLWRGGSELGVADACEVILANIKYIR